MFEFLREWMKSTAVKRQEMLNAYLDGELSTREQVVFERLLADDATLQQELADRQLIKSQLQQLPRMAVPRNFILDAKQYQTPPKRPLITYHHYPVLRGATALTAVLFIFTLGWSLMSGGGVSYEAAPAQVIGVVEVVTETVVEEEAIEEEVAEVVEEAEEFVAEAPAEEEMIEEEIELPAESVPAAAVGVAEDAMALPVELTPVAAVGLAEEVADDDEVVNKSMMDEQGSVYRETAVVTATVTAVPMETAVSTPTPIAIPMETAVTSSTFTPIQIIQIGLFGLFIALLVITFYAKRQ